MQVTAESLLMLLLRISASLFANNSVKKARKLKTGILLFGNCVV